MSILKISKDYQVRRHWTCKHINITKIMYKPWKFWLNKKLHICKQYLGWIYWKWMINECSVITCAWDWYRWKIEVKGIRTLIPETTVIIIQRVNVNVLNVMFININSAFLSDFKKYEKSKKFCIDFIHISIFQITVSLVVMDRR